MFVWDQKNLKNPHYSISNYFKKSPKKSNVEIRPSQNCTIMRPSIMMAKKPCCIPKIPKIKAALFRGLTVTPGWNRLVGSQKLTD